MHDKNGQKLEPGDKVAVEFTVKSVMPGTTCNTTLERNEPGEQSLTLSCQANQTVKIAPAQPQPGAKPDGS